MSNLDKNSKDILMGTLIGGILGICIASIFLNKNKKNKSSLGKIVSHMEEMITNRDLVNHPMVHHVEKKMHKHEDTINDALDFIVSGIHLWKKFKKE